jgi:aspartyl-tRNA(Asn)/glutamyl-tRNA(Gln) amidotransferase subunit A
VPAALSGVVGLKATLGRVPTDGVVSLAWTMDHVAPMAASVADAALVLEVLAGAPGAFVGATSRGVSGLRVGTVDAAFVDAAEALAIVVRDRIADLALAGAEVVSASTPTIADFDLANAGGLIVSRCEAASFHAGMGLDRSRYWDEVGGQLDEAETTLAVDYLAAQRARRDLRDRMLDVFSSVDVLVMPTVPVTAPLITDFARYLMVLSRNAILWSFAGFPAISVPCGTVEGLPVGMQIVAAPWREDLVLAAATEVERATARAVDPPVAAAEDRPSV